MEIVSIVRAIDKSKAEETFNAGDSINTFKLID
jgi:hypothetical protein